MNRTHTRVLAVLAILAVIASLVPLGAEGANVATPLGKSLDGWKAKGPIENSKWAVGQAKVDPGNPRQLVVEPLGDGPAELATPTGHGHDIYTAEKFGDCTVELEVMVPNGSNSGIYLMGEYEVQVLDSFGKERVGPGDMGGLYGATAPSVNASKAPGEWQKYVIEFQAPKFVDGQKTDNAKFIKVTLNGQVIHENVVMQKQTPGGVSGKEAPTGPLMFQGNHGSVAYRNIKITLP